MMNIRKQRGEGFWGLVFLLAIIGVVVWIGLMLIPVYMENGSIVHSLEGLKEKPEIKQQNPSSVKSMLKKAFSINDVGSHISDDNITVTPTSTGGFTVTIAYDRVIHLVSNISFLVSFENSVEI